MTVSGMAHDHLCKQYRGVINCHPFAPSPTVLTHITSHSHVNGNQSHLYLGVSSCEWPVRTGLGHPVLWMTSLCHVSSKYTIQLGANMPFTLFYIALSTLLSFNGLLPYCAVSQVNNDPTAVHSQIKAPMP